MNVQKLLKKKAGIFLDVSLGGEPQANSVTFADLKRSPLKIPWPLPNKCVHTAVVFHVLEFLEPSIVFDWFDELHRVMRPGGLVYCTGPHGGDEMTGWIADPTHRVRIIEATFAWLDPRAPLYNLHDTMHRRKPKPWHTLAQARVPGTLGTVSYNTTLQAAEVGGKS